MEGKIVKRARTTAKSKAKERRKYQRLKLSIPVRFKLLPKAKILQEEFCQDISGGGIGLRLDRPLSKGKRLKTLLYFLNDPKPISAVGEVAWCKKSKETRKKRARFDIGIQYVKIISKDRQRFIFLFCEMMINHFLFSKAR